MNAAVPARRDGNDAAAQVGHADGCHVMGVLGERSVEETPLL